MVSQIFSKALKIFANHPVKIAVAAFVVLSLLLVAVADWPIVQTTLPNIISDPFVAVKEWLVGLLGLFGEEPETDEGPDMEEEYLISVDVAPVLTRDLQTTLESFGTFTFYEKVEVGAVRSGRVVELNVPDLGGMVEEGEAMATIDPTELEIDRLEAVTNRRQRQLEKNQSRSSLQELRVQLKQNRAEYVSNLERLRFKNQSYERDLKLYQIGALTPRELSKSAEERFERVSSLLQARLTLLRTKRQINQSDFDIQLSEAQVEKAEQQIDRIEYQLEESTVEAPRTGVVAAKNVSEGEVLESGSRSIATLLDIGQLYLEARIPETELHKVDYDQEVIIQPDAYPDMQVRGVVSTIDPVINKQDRMATVRVLVDNQDYELRPGMFASASFIVEEVENVVSVPREALMDSPDPDVQYEVYVVSDGVAVSRSVSVGSESEEFVEVTDGVEPGEKVVIDGQDRLDDFVQVEAQVPEEYQQQ